MSPELASIDCTSESFVDGSPVVRSDPVHEVTRPSPDGRRTRTGLGRHPADATSSSTTPGSGQEVWIPRNRGRHPRLLVWRSLHAACSGRLARAGTHVDAWASSTGCAVSGRFRGIVIDTRGCWRRAPCSRQVAPGAGQAPPDHRRTARKPDRFASAPGRRVPAMSSSTTPESCQEVWIRCGDTPGYDLGRSRGGSVSERAGQRRVARCQQRPAQRDHGTDHSLRMRRTSAGTSGDRGGRL